MGRFSKNTKMLNFMKIRPIGAEFLADGRTDGQTRRSYYSLFTVLRTRLKSKRQC